VILGQESGGLEYTNIWPTFIRFIVIFAQGELPRKARAELPKYLSYRPRKNHIQFGY
jgi:hypothetical protein